MTGGVALNAPEVEEGYLLVSDEVELGIEPDWDFFVILLLNIKISHKDE